MNLFPPAHFKNAGGENYRQFARHFLDCLMESFLATGRPISLRAVVEFLAVPEPRLSERLLMLEGDCVDVGAMDMSMLLSLFRTRTPAGIFLDEAEIQHTLGGLLGRLNSFQDGGARPRTAKRRGW